MYILNNEKWASLVFMNENRLTIKRIPYAPCTAYKNVSYKILFVKYLLQIKEIEG